MNFIGEIFIKIKNYLKKGILIIIVPAIFVYLMVNVFRGIDSLWQSLFLKIFAFKLYSGVGFGLTIILLIVLGWISSWKFVKNSKFFQFVKSLPKKIFFSRKNILDKEKLRPALAKISQNLYLIVFVTNEINIEGKKFYKVFFPTVPAGVTGYLAVISEDKIIFLENSTLETISIVMSYGMPKTKLKIIEKHNARE